MKNILSRRLTCIAVLSLVTAGMLGGCAVAKHKKAPQQAQRIEPPLIAAARAGDVAQVEKLLNNGANINVRNDHKMTPLIIAAAAGHQEVVAILLSRGADPNLVGAKGHTAREAAMEHGHAELARILRNAEVRAPSGPANPIPAPGGYPPERIAPTTAPSALPPPIASPEVQSPAVAPPGEPRVEPKVELPPAPQGEHQIELPDPAHAPPAANVPTDSSPATQPGA